MVSIDNQARYAPDYTISGRATKLRRIINKSKLVKPYQDQDADHQEAGYKVRNIVMVEGRTYRLPLAPLSGITRFQFVDEVSLTHDVTLTDNHAEVKIRNGHNVTHLTAEDALGQIMSIVKPALFGRNHIVDVFIGPKEQG